MPKSAKKYVSVECYAYGVVESVVISEAGESVFDHNREVKVSVWRLVKPR